MKRSSRGVTLTELMIGVAIMGVAVAAFGTLLRSVITATTGAQTKGEAQEETRQALSRIEETLVQANEVKVASAAYVEFVADIDQSPAYDRSADWDADGIPNYRDGDRDNDAQQLLPAATQWRAGFNLKDDDEDGDGQVDVRQRIYLSGGTVWLQTSLDGAAWGAGRQLMTSVSTFTLSYFGNKANNLGRNIDLDGDGVISASEMDMAGPPGGMGNQNGVLDTDNERRYVTAIRLSLGSDKNQDGKTDYVVETDVYPPLLPLKSR
ncbi:MAG: prepilin-type N-terminal cleavage/methylation domain-containing protein [Elusimicrobia bacterium]|nr:prepilin-type N-terminal cleavage/methylation domain-containing protein [Elusimicrobiota bacterium]